MTEDINRRLHESPEYRQEQLSAALDGMLAPEEQAALDAHLAGCDTCTRELAELRQVRMLLRAMPAPALPRSFLLPTEGELVTAPHRAARPAERAPATTPNVTPLRPPTRRPTRTLQVTRWIGTIAAVLGMALFLGTLLAHQGAMNSASAPNPAQSHYSAPNPNAAGGTADGGTTPAPTRTFSSGGPQATDKGATATPSPTVSATMPARSSGTPVTTPVSPSSGPTTGDILRVVALVLLFGGVAVAIVSLVAARRV